MQAPSHHVYERWRQAYPGLDTSSMEVVGPLKRVQALLDLAVEPLFDGASVTSPELDVLLILRYTEQPTIARQLARKMSRSPAALSKTLAKLERRGYISRTANPADRRTALVRLTDEGREVVNTLFPQQLAVEVRLLSGMTPQQRAQIIDGLTQLVEVMEAGLRDMTAP
ncbi:MarR family winged helix-turn-helix transcriptional regulator [Streptosporangium saharense]|uniref:DNA-binding MarR family transcriptional regulator n=1 Tax=Streptosporangium saharense TaxID=1706840 RepID=A0A7W7QSM4_9ACTN|nr:MarR family transcriptional regulator [Streptosporangium saharense]MBB4918743.1 DNA-binding MarR family transcriptional regulator [Streptosporangium saharense]